MVLSQVSVLAKLDEGKTMFVYLVVLEEVVTTLLIKEPLDEQTLMCFVSEAMYGPMFRH